MNIVCQPFGDRLGDRLIECLHAPYQYFKFAVAYAKTSGTDHLIGHMQHFVQNGGTISGSVGVDQQNTSKEALEYLLDVSNELFIFHNERLDSTFHPKLYIFGNAQRAMVFIGSNNLTAGGLYTNYELAAGLEYDLTSDTERTAYQALLERIGPYFDPDNPCCLAADRALLQRLCDDGYVLTEEQLSANLSRAAAGVSKTGKGGRMFGASIYQAPAVARGRRQTRTSPVKATGEAIVPSGFWKKMSRNDVSLSSSPGQIIIPIRFKHFFAPFENPQKTDVGATQSERFFNLLFVSSGSEDVLVENARVILYVPASEHPRQNSEIRFTFRNRAVFGRLREGDVLKFENATAEEYAFVVTHIPADMAGAYEKRYGTIAE